MQGLLNKSRKVAKVMLTEYVVLHKKDAPAVLPGAQVPEADLGLLVAETLEGLGE